MQIQLITKITIRTTSNAFELLLTENDRFQARHSYQKVGTSDEKHVANELAHTSISRDIT